MAVGRLEIVQGAATTEVIDLVDVNGDPLTYAALAGAGSSFLLRTTPTGTNVLAFSTPDAVHLVIDANASTITVTINPADVATVPLGPYFYQVTLTLASGAVSQPVPWTPADVVLGGSASPPPPPFTNTVALTQDFGLPGDLSYFTPGGTPIQGAQVRVYLKSDFDVGNFGSPIGITTTNAFGGWTDPIFVTPGYTYTVQFVKPNEFGPDSIDVVGV